jgi:metallophosphoesterase superfamily enzyme
MTAVDFLLKKITLKKLEHDVYLYPRVTNKDIEQVKEMEKQKVIEFLDWLTNEKSEFSIMYGNQDKRFSSNDKDYTINEIIEIFENRYNLEKKHTYSKIEKL